MMRPYVIAIMIFGACGMAVAAIPDLSLRTDTVSGLHGEAMSCWQKITPGGCVSYRSRQAHNSPHKRYRIETGDDSRHASSAMHPAQLIRIAGQDGDTLCIEIKTVEKSDILSSEPAMSVTAEICKSGTHRPCGSFTATKGLSLYSGFNNWRVCADTGAVRLYGGMKTPQEVASFEIQGFTPSEIAFGTAPGGELHISERLHTPPSGVPSEQRRSLSHDEIWARLGNTSDINERMWRLHDHTLDESLLRLGGDYRLAMVADGDSDYMLIYISGAVKQPGLWKEGDVKAILKAVSPGAIYSVTWFDSEAMPMSHAIKGELDAMQGILTIFFPYQNSHIRLVRMPHEERGHSH